MKKIIIMIIMLFSVAGLFAAAVIVQDHYRWRNDDGSETAATWMAAEDTGINIDTDANIRIRFDLHNEVDDTEATLSDANLQYSLDETVWVDVTTDGSTNHFVLSLSDYFADGDPAPSDFLTNETTNNDSGELFETTTNFGGTFAVLTNYEYEWCIKPTANVTNADYYFRVTGTVSGGQFTNTFSNARFALLTYGTPTPVTLTNFTAEYTAEGLSIYWTTHSETGNLGWNIYRGESNISHQNDESMQINPSLIPGAGTTSEQSDYVFIDEYEVNGNTTYWYWIESRSNSGQTETFGPTIITIPVDEEEGEIPQYSELIGNFPNPINLKVNTVTNIEFAVKENESGILTVYNSKGQKVETFEYVAGKHTHLLNVKSYYSGVYFYELKTGNFKEVKKMMIIR